MVLLFHEYNYSKGEKKSLQLKGHVWKEKKQRARSAAAAFGGHPFIPAMDLAPRVHYIYIHPQVDHIWTPRWANIWKETPR